jgi:KDO2-lipid IV(A) lauroyltransferase
VPGPDSSPFEDGLGLALRYYGFRSGAWLAERLPLPVTEAAARLGGRLGLAVSPRKREIVRRNLSRIDGAGDDPDLVRDAYLSYARYWLETLRLGRYSHQDLLDMVDAVNIEIVESALAAGTGLIVVLPHFGFYDLIGAWGGAKGYPLTTVAEVLKPRQLFEWFVAVRERSGMKILPASKGAATLRGLLRALHRGEIVALVADRDLGRRGVWVEYFGEPTTAPVGPPLLAARTGAPLAAAAFYQTGMERGRPTYRLELTEVPYERTGDERADIAAIAQLVASALEEVVRKAPAQYHLFSTNWPSDEPDLPPRGHALPSGTPPGGGPPEAEPAP